MFPHHADSVANLVREFEGDPDVHALLLGGSIAHGFAKPDSDIDVTFVIGSDAYARRQREHRMHYNNRSLCTYAGGYIDGKFADLAFLRTVAERGSDPARYAFEGNRILFSRVPELPQLLGRIVRYPVEEKGVRLERFSAQLLAWRWYYTQGARQESRYLVMLAVQRVVLFACRIVLTVNEQLFPYHKWMLKVVARVPRKPDRFLEDIEALLAAPDWEQVDRFTRGVLAFAGVEFATADAVWPTWFMKDTELRWVEQAPAIEDV